MEIIDFRPERRDFVEQVCGRPVSRRHPFKFNQRLGFTVVGVLPDANGPGQPDIYMAKRVLVAFRSYPIP